MKIPFWDVVDGELARVFGFGNKKGVMNLVNERSAYSN